MISSHWTGHLILWFKQMLTNKSIIWSFNLIPICYWVLICIKPLLHFWNRIDSTCFLHLRNCFCSSQLIICRLLLHSWYPTAPTVVCGWVWVWVGLLAAVVIRPPALVSPGSPGPMSCLATAALTLALSRTSVRCVRRSSPAAITCPNTRRSIAAPDPAGLSELPCDSQLAPKICPASILAPSSGCSRTQDSSRSSVDLSDEIWEPAAVSSAFLPCFLSSLPFICQSRTGWRASSGKCLISWPSHTPVKGGVQEVDRNGLLSSCLHTHPMRAGMHQRPNDCSYYKKIPPEVMWTPLQSGAGLGLLSHAELQCQYLTELMSRQCRGEVSHTLLQLSTVISLPPFSPPSRVLQQNL